MTNQSTHPNIISTGPAEGILPVEGRTPITVIGTNAIRAGFEKGSLAHVLKKLSRRGLHKSFHGADLRPQERWRWPRQTVRPGQYAGRTDPPARAKQTEVAVGRADPTQVLEPHKKVQIAFGLVKIGAGTGSKKLQLNHMVLSAQRFNLRKPFVNQREHRG
jgi:hypothetical protein